MMRLAVDLHIHSALSPCADDDMTPGNIAGMAAIKGLDYIAVTDHNSAGNLKAVIEAAQEYGVMVLPGLEANTAEEIHVLCYFARLEQAQEMSLWIYERLPQVDNMPEFFGRQVYMDSCDNVLAEEPRLLISAAGCTLEELAAKTCRLGGVAVPAHINKGANSLLPVLGFFPEKPAFTAVEIWGADTPVEAQGYLHLRSSDAHSLGDIFERKIFLETENKSPEAVLAAFG